MGLLSTIRERRVYLDTNVFIYAVEGYSAFESELRELFEHIDQGSLEAITSELTLAEVLVKPFIDQDEIRRRAYQQALQETAFFHLVSVTRTVLIEAARLRAHSSLKLPDAIHLVTAQHAGCRTFLTNDAQLRGRPEVDVVLLSEVIDR